MPRPVVPKDEAATRVALTVLIAYDEREPGEAVDPVEDETGAAGSEAP